MDAGPDCASRTDPIRIPVGATCWFAFTRPD
jgi:hypothetical protein